MRLRIIDPGECNCFDYAVFFYLVFFALNCCSSVCSSVPCFSPISLSLEALADVIIISLLCLKLANWMGY